MKIIQIMPEFGIGGAEIMCENLAYALQQLNHTVIVVSLFDYHSPITNRLEKSGIQVVYLNKRKGFDISMYKKLLNLFKSEKPDVIHTHRNSTQYAFPIVALMKLKCVHTVHNVANKENILLLRVFNKMFYKHFNITPVALSELIQKTIVKEYKLNKLQIPVVLNGIDLSKCKPKENYSVNGNFKILHIGRFSYQKNHIGLLEAFKMFHDKHHDSELWLIGDGEEKSNIEKYVFRNSLVESVKFLGLQSSTYDFLHDADMFTLPSNYEGIPMTLIEAMGTGLPIVATAVGGVPDILSNHKNALLTEVNSKDISAALCELATNKILCETLGRAAKEQSIKFSAETMAKRYLETYVK